MKKKQLIDNPTISNVVFYPRKTKIPEKLESNIKVLKFDIHDNISIGGFFFGAKTENPTILLFHGNGEIASDYQYISHLFLDCNVNLAVVDFRGYGFSSGEPYFTSLISDAMPIYDAFKQYLAEMNYLDSLFVQGRSLGSVCAAEIGANNPPKLRGVIFESGFASIFNMMTNLFRISSPYLTPDSLKEYSNDTRVQKFKVPTLIIHGTTDWIIPYTESQLLYQNLPNNVEKKLILINEAGHNNILSFKQDYFSPLLDFVQKYK
ncbi:MAG TPA: alpha/beta fold hydrolase [Candidatus Nanopelagicaceae bacterium]|jgi:pimeloyl-ACP methyl ester carboxylesterase|nr:alpha/beta fold hydrolase [Candidatus Nanopelagicaceae bacterium]